LKPLEILVPEHLRVKHFLISLRIEGTSSDGTSNDTQAGDFNALKLFARNIAEREWLKKAGSQKQVEHCRIVLELLASIRPAAIVETGTLPARPQSGGGAVRRSDLLLRARSALLPAGARKAHALSSSPGQHSRFAGVPSRSSA
jgi:hypothetical protein